VASVSIKRSNTILYCEQWTETVDFYRRVLGLPVTIEKDWFVELRLAETAFVSVAQAARASIPSARGQGLTLSLQVDDVAAAHGRLVRAGVEPGPLKRHRWGSLGFFCRDPEGYRLELWQPLSP